MNKQELRKKIRNILEQYFSSLSEGGNSMDSMQVYPYSANKFPYYKGPTSPQDLAIDANAEFDLNSDNSEEYLKRDALPSNPVIINDPYS